MTTTASSPADRTLGGDRALNHLLAGEASYLTLYDFSRVDRIDLIRQGVPARLLTVLASDMNVSRERLYGWLGIPRATANRKVKANQMLGQDESERTLGLARLVGLVQKIVTESGEPAGFDAAQWTAAWLERPNQALGGRAPGDFLDTADGRALVSGLVGQMQSGAYA